LEEGAQMKPIEWKEEYNVDNNFVDEHHMKFLEILNELGTISGDNCTDKITKIFYSLIHYTENYLIKEEIYFQEYPNLAHHKEAHNRFIEQISKLQDDYKEGKQEICEDMYVYLHNWFKNHILKYDKEAVNYLKNKGVQ